MNTYHYTYLITNLNPTTNEKYYIGSRTCHCLPAADEYLGSSTYLNNAIKLYGSNTFEKIIIAEWESRPKANFHEEWLHNEYNVAKNDMFYNKSKAKSDGFCGGAAESIAKHKETKANPVWKATIGRQQHVNRVKTMTSKVWQQNEINRIKKLKETKANPVWKATIGAASIQKMLKTKASASWQQSVGTATKEKIRKTKTDPLWILTIEKERQRKRSETLLTPEYIKNNTFICPHCGAIIKGRGAFNRWHDNKCKLKRN